MGHSPITRELQPLTKPTGRQVKAQVEAQVKAQVKAADTQWAKLDATIADPDLPAVVAFCAIGLLLALNLILRFPDFGAVIEQYNQF